MHRTETMTFYFLIILAIIFIFLVGILIPDYVRLRKTYQYKRKMFFMTRAEHQCYDVLTKAIGDKYIVFAQVHLPTIINNKVIGQNWLHSFRHINQKSVDFVLCDKEYISPVLAIELDDSTHELQERQERDSEVERILKGAGVPLLRIKNQRNFDQKVIFEKITQAITRNSTH